MEQQFLAVLGTVGLVVFALSGALVAARKKMDPFGFSLLATVTAIGGGTLRDMLLSHPVYWIADPTSLVLSFSTGALTFALARRIDDFIPMLERWRALLWADALGLAIFAVTGADIARAAGAHWFTAMALGALTASFGGVIRDILAGEPPMVLHGEIYVTAAFAAAAVNGALAALAAPPALAIGAGVFAGFALRGLAIRQGWALPLHRG